MNLIKVSLTKDISFTATPEEYTEARGGILYKAGTNLEVHPKYIERLEATKCIKVLETVPDTPPDLESMNKSELIELAKAKDIEVKPNLNKKEIINLITNG